MAKLKPKSFIGLRLSLSLSPRNKNGAYVFGRCKPSRVGVRVDVNPLAVFDPILPVGSLWIYSDECEVSSIERHPIHILKRILAREFTCCGIVESGPEVPKTAREIFTFVFSRLIVFQLRFIDR